MIRSHILSSLRRTAAFFGAFIWFLTANIASGHEPFDLSSRLTIHSDRLELVATMGPDATRRLLEKAERSPQDIAQTLRTLGPGTTTTQPAAIADILFTLGNDGQKLNTTHATSLSEGMEIIFTFTYPRPSHGNLEVQIKGYETLPDLRSSPLVVEDESTGRLAGSLMTKDNNVLSLALPKTAPRDDRKTSPTEPVSTAAKAEPTEAKPAAAPPVPENSLFKDFFKLGVEHILSGIDHLLFLTALLLGVRKISGVLGVITYFTLAHSVTLALAALNVVTLSPRIVEPLIAASIIAVCCDNFFRRQHERDRWWLAGGFGLIHGFGFASALRETGLVDHGAALVTPLLSFNLGVEAGQLAVASLLLPILFFAQRWDVWRRYGMASVLSGVIAVSGYWLVQRLFMS